MVAVRPVDVAAVNRHPTGEGGAGDEALVRVLPVQVGAADRAESAVRPVDVAAVNRHPTGAGGAGDEALVRVLPVQVGAADRADVAVRPVDVAGDRAGSGERDARAGGRPSAVRRERGRGLTGRGGGVLDGDVARLARAESGPGAGVGGDRKLSRASERNAQHPRRRAARVGERERLRLRVADRSRPVVEDPGRRDRRPRDGRQSSSLAQGGGKRQYYYGRSRRNRGPDDPNDSKCFPRCFHS